MKYLTIALLCLCLLTACGQRGPLYLPESSPPAPADNPDEKESTEADSAEQGNEHIR